MNIFSHLSSGVSRALRSWKWILIIWLVTFLMVSLVAVPFRAGIYSMLGKSMITDLLRNGISIDVIANTGTSLTLLTKMLFSGMSLVLFTGLLINVFFTGGLFTVLIRKDEQSKNIGFFKGAAGNFWPILVISIMIYLMILLMLLIITGIPSAVVQGSQSEKAMITVVKVSGIIFIVLLPVILLVADYSRAWLVSSGQRNAFRALGNGFRLAFGNFFSSYAVMAVIIIVQAVFSLCVYYLASGWKPQSGGGIFLMFILFQALLIIKIMIRAWRYGSITSLFEK